MDRKSFFKRVAALTAGAVVVASGIPVPEESVPDVPGIGSQSFKIILDQHFCVGDIIRTSTRHEYYVLDVKGNKVTMQKIQRANEGGPHDPPITMELVSLEELNPHKVCSAALEA